MDAFMTRQQLLAEVHRLQTELKSVVTDIALAREEVKKLRVEMATALLAASSEKTNLMRECAMRRVEVKMAREAADAVKAQAAANFEESRKNLTAIQYLLRSENWGQPHAWDKAQEFLTNGKWE